MLQEHRVLLSGTPLQNNVNELFSLLNFLEPTQFSSSEAFLQEFGALKTETEVQKLQLILKPMMLRRLKEDVEKSIAPKEETVVEVSNRTCVRSGIHLFIIAFRMKSGNLCTTPCLHEYDSPPTHTHKTSVFRKIPAQGMFTYVGVHKVNTAYL